MIELGIFMTILSPYLALLPTIIMIYKIYKNKLHIYINPLNIGLFALFMWSFISGIINLDILSCLSSFLFLLYLALSIYIQNNYITEMKIDDFIYKVWKISLVAGFIGVIEKLASYYIDMTWVSDIFWSPNYTPSAVAYRIYSTFGNPNVAGTWFAAMILVSLYLFQQSYKEKKILYLLSMTIFVFTLIFTGSKGATIGLEVAILGYALLKKNKKSKIILISIFFIILILAFLSPEINHRLNTRYDLWYQCILLFKQSPIFGLGLMGIFKNTHQVHAHNTCITLLTSIGFIGLSLYLVMKFYLFKDIQLLYIKDNKLVPLFGAIQALFIAHGVIDFTIMAPQGGMLYFTSIAFISSLAMSYKYNYIINFNGFRNVNIQKIIDDSIRTNYPKTALMTIASHEKVTEIK